MTAGEDAAAALEEARYRRLPLVAHLWLMLAAIGSVAISVYVIFGLGNTFGTYVPLETEYFYVMLALLLPLAFLLYPLTKAGKVRIPIYDWALAIVALIDWPTSGQGDWLWTSSLKLKPFS